LSTNLIYLTDTVNKFGWHCLYWRKAISCGEVSRLSVQTSEKIMRKKHALRSWPAAAATMRDVMTYQRSAVNAYKRVVLSRATSEPAVHQRSFNARLQLNRRDGPATASRRRRRRTSEFNYTTHYNIASCSFLQMF